MSKLNKFNDFLKSFLIWFIVFYVALLGFDYFFGDKDKKNGNGSESAITIKPVDDSIVLGNLAQFKVINKTEQKIVFTPPCENPESLQVFRKINDQEVVVSDFSNCEKKSVKSLTLEPNHSDIFSFKHFNADVFTESGNYQIRMQFLSGEETQTITSETIEFDSPGVFRQLFRAIISKPLFNLLVFFTEKLPTHSLGWSIVLLTVLVRIILFLPNQKAMRSQHELQKLQPKMQELREKYGKNQQMLAMKTMELYKTHKINPMSSCLPILLQMPFLIGIYFVVRDGLSPHMKYLLYKFNATADLTIVDPQFFGMNLEALPAWWGLPILVGLSQFLALKLSFASAAKRKSKSPVPPADGMMGQMEQMQKMMLWILPVMIGFFTVTFPAAVGIYWLASTVFGIGQQKILYWQMDRPQIVKKID